MLFGSQATNKYGGWAPHHLKHIWWLEGRTAATKHPEQKKKNTKKTDALSLSL
jgi:hypothetical protein